MAFLLAKIVFLLALTALLSAAITWWWMRTRFEDVTEVYARLADADAEAERRVARLERELAEARNAIVSGASEAPTQPDDGGKLAALEQELAGREAKILAQQEQIEALEVQVATAPTPSPAPRGDEALRSRVIELELALKVASSSSDGAEAKVEQLEAALAQAAARERALQADLNACTGLVTRLRETPLPAHEPVPVPVAEPVAEPEAAAEPEPEPVAEAEPVPEPVPVPEPAPAATPQPAALTAVLASDDGTNRLSHAAFGAPDELQRIKGVGPKLSKMLHGIGVFYFWQVAAWSDADVERVDELLEAFQGRIRRDRWVAQAGALAEEPGAAKPPA
ncbi:MAG: hypothetical protein R3F59_10545 [Myxococcota bacterium]